jgi:hypothetical protein
MISCQRKLVVILASIAWTSCAQPRSYGDFLVHVTPKDEDTLAADAAQQLKRLYAPGSTHVAIAAPTDPFGKALSSRLRQLGFAVMDGDRSDNPKNATRLRYVVDDIGEQFFRTVLMVAPQRGSGTRGILTARAYMRTPRGPAAAGPWTNQTR